MCGISGVFSDTLTEQHQTIIENIVKNQFNRGPDHQHIQAIQGHSSHALLGHNRLSIIDLSTNANQPMWDSTFQYCISYNGEIYNYLELRQELIALGLTFNTNSDTEVILNAFSYWGIDALNRFYGPFAFALFDKQRDELWLCRDRFAVRPLYYIQVNKSLYFASSTASLAKALNLKPNLSYMAKGLKYLVYEDDTSESAYEGLISLQGGCYLKAKLNQQQEFSLELKEYYNLSNHVQTLASHLASCSTSQLLYHVSDTFEKAVHIRLRTDVPLAISLSSGLDSSSVAALVSQQNKKTIGFSFGHPEHHQTEGPLVDQCAKHLDINMEYVWPTANEMVKSLHDTIEAQDAPFSSLSIVAQYLLYKKVRSSGIKVLLGGQGGDELFMGYRKYIVFWLQKLIKESRYISAGKNLLQFMPMFMAELPSLGVYWRHRHRYSNQSAHTHSLNLPEAPVLHLNMKKEQALWVRQMQDVKQTSLPTLLRYEDRNAMGNSVESRLPFLDHRLVELGLALPESFKIQKGYGKWPIREIMNHKIPNKIRLARYKRGFDISMRSLLDAGLGESIRSTLKEKPAILKEFLKETTNVDSIFSDKQLLDRRSAMIEAISLLWLNKVYA